MAHLIDNMNEEEIIEHCKGLYAKELYALMYARDYTFDENESTSRNIRIFAEIADKENAELNYQ